ncbi:MAG: hypothetical protein WCW17_00370 [Patescibacteria group bacterium]|jgi:hypothetical protein
MKIFSEQTNLSPEEEKKKFKERKKFVDFVNKVLDKLEKKEIDRKETAYQIAELMFDPEIEKDEEMFDIATVAGDLELPDHHIPGDPEKLWQEFIAIFKDWEKKYFK